VTTDPNDLRQLHPLSARAQATLGVEALEVVADGGYFSSVQVHRCHRQQIHPYLPEPTPHGPSAAKGRLEREAFVYEGEHDRFRCPEGRYLRPTGKPREQAGHPVQCYRSRRSECRECPLRAKCLSARGQYREIWRDLYEADLQAVRQRRAAHPERLAERCALVEHPFGTLKRRAGWDHFLVRGLEKVRGEWSLMALAYNFTRVLNLLGPERFREICRQLVHALEDNTETNPSGHPHRRPWRPGYALLGAFRQLCRHTHSLRARRLAACA